MRTSLILLALAGMLPAQAAGIRGYVTLADQSVHLSDLFSDLAPGQDQVIGPAPAPGRQIMVPATQLAAIAGQFGVDWHAGAGGDNVILASPGQPLATSAVLAPLQTALIAQGAPAQSDVALTGFAPPLVAPDDQISVMVGSLAYDQATGDFSALVTIAGAKTPAASLRVSGNVAELAELPVLSHLLPEGQAITADDVALTQVRLPHNSTPIARSAAQVIGQALRHVVPAGAPVPLAELVAPVAVAANALVEMDLQMGALSLQGRAIAEQAGAVGDRIRVRNPSSLAVMVAEITGPGQVRVDPDSQPIFSIHNQEIAVQ